MDQRKSASAHRRGSKPALELANVGNLGLAILHQLAEKERVGTQADLRRHSASSPPVGPAVPALPCVAKARAAHLGLGLGDGAVDDVLPAAGADAEHPGRVQHAAGRAGAPGHARSITACAGSSARGRDAASSGIVPMPLPRPGRPPPPAPLGRRAPRTHAPTTRPGTAPQCTGIISQGRPG